MKKLIWIVLVGVILGGCSSYYSIVNKPTAVAYVCYTQSTDRTNKEHIEILNQYMGKLDNVKVLVINEITSGEMPKHDSECKDKHQFKITLHNDKITDNEMPKYDSEYKDKPHFKITFQIEKNLCAIAKLSQTLPDDGYWLRCLTMDEVILTTR
ncbi:MAG: hypothetical protein V1709_00420 [Planctomycetota bacterium]